MNGTVLYDGTRWIPALRAVDEMGSGACLAAAAVSRDVHGLVAIANGPDYCLCGRTWPCEQRAASA
ncbi:hypothetical protein KGA66_04475 [Actinocrinis puniceicyclus]|uniref:Uncharacterized protein n=1 Tax=Actinocrinis puniceicyclus TaxID=977794 RepID=A0A8J8BD02_9ACTN|nr:hypothetical protein [Actinocrinis puniceicyclus]MBS2962289.1 hypothetical protein [Actinocrinis puniceicyclus]